MDIIRCLRRERVVDWEPSKVDLYVLLWFEMGQGKPWRGEWTLRYWLAWAPKEPTDLLYTQDNIGCLCCYEWGCQEHQTSCPVSVNVSVDCPIMHCPTWLPPISHHASVNMATSWWAFLQMVRMCHSRHTMCSRISFKYYTRYAKLAQRSSTIWKQLQMHEQP